ncbi:MAG: LacI family DNA-binding transcriptional regulator [Oscillospiraceae bacterium]|nr:LacI family DNA-binding transcriptional regulator [Oscillospiraceae bacterium]
MSVTIKDVARAAGVSVATVSRVLNSSATVSEATAQQVNDAIDALGYSPNFLGRNLRKCETNKILAVIPSTEHTFYSDILRGLQDAASPVYDVIISTSHSYLATEMRLLNMLFNRTVDAAVLLGTQLDADKLNELNGKYNLALCCERVEGAKLLTVTIDDEKGAYDATEVLIKKGHKRIGLVTAANSAPSSTDREKGYRAALSKHGIGFDDSIVYRGSYDYEDGAMGYHKLMNAPEPPTAIFCISDILAVGTVRCAHEDGLEVGKDIDVMGFDNTTLSKIYIPGITTVAQPGYEMGFTVMKKLLENMSSEYKDNSHIKLSHSIVSRESARLDDAVK